MKKLLLALGILALICSPAMAGRNANGAMLLHTNDAVNFTTLNADYCSDNAPSAPLPPNCDGLVTITHHDPNLIEAVVWMVGAFANGSSPAVTAYQVGLYGTVFNSDMSGYAVCGQVLELPDTGWPGAGTGTAVTYTSGAVTSQLFKMYWFAAAPAAGVGAILATGNYYNQDHHAEWVDNSSPPQVDFCNLFGSVGWGVEGTKNCPGQPHVGACCFPDGHCEVLDQTACNGVYQGDGTLCDPNPCPPPVGACCLNGNCIGNLIETDCVAHGGTWEGFGTDCATFQCPQPPPTGACCINQVCTMQTQAECVANGGTYQGDNVQCTPDLCVPPPPTGACCIGTECRVLSQADCATAGGTYRGDGTNCDNNPCATPVKSTTWGAIKGQYR